MVAFTGNTFHNGKNSKRLDVFKVGARERGKYECASGPIPVDQSQRTLVPSVVVLRSVAIIYFRRNVGA